jgi:amidase
MIPRMPAAALTFTPLLDLRQQLRQRQISPVELLDACIAAIETLNPTLNAFTTLTLDAAREQAAASAERLRQGQAGDLEGLPIGIKENLMLAGTGLSLGSNIGIGFELPTDSVLAARLRRQGAVFPGKTNMPEFGTIGRTESRRFGVCRNPWDPDRTPGGSSGGSGAAVAAGMVPAAHGNDGGGSLRIPASCCGLFSLKPSRGRISHQPLSEVPHLLSQGFLTRTVADNALLVDAVDGFVPGDPYAAPAKARPYLEEARTEPGSLRIAWTARPPVDRPVDPACLEAVEGAARLCESLGHRVEQRDLDWRDDNALDLFVKLWAPAIAFGIELLGELGQDVQSVEPHNRAMLEMARALDASHYLVAAYRAGEFAQRVQALWEEVDVVLTPTLAQLPLPAGTVAAEAEANPLGPLMVDEGFTPFTAIINITGQPAASLPLHWSGGLPVGVQAIGRMGDEATLYRLSAQLEAARPWADRRPPRPGAPAEPARWG